MNTNPSITKGVEAQALERFSYDNVLVRNFAIASIIWGFAGMLVGLIVALQFVLPDYFLWDGISWLSFGRLRPLHTNAVIFAFVGNGIFMGVYYSLQRLVKARMYSDLLGKIHFWGWQAIIVAALISQTIGSQLSCIFVDNGMLRQGEREQVEREFTEHFKTDLHVVDARERSLTELAGVSDPQQKRKIIGREFIRTFEQAEAQLVAEAKADNRPIKFLVQGTLYPDVVESGGGVTAGIKSHHNVGGLPDDMQFELVEPLRTLFKDEVRAIGADLGLPKEIVGRHPFPGPGLGIRIVGEVTKERLELLRDADAIVREELTAAGMDQEIWQAPVVLLADVRSVGVQGDGRTYGHPIVLRPVSSEDAMTADWSRLPYDLLAKISNRITNEVSGVNRVVLDITSKPPGTIEWE